MTELKQTVALTSVNAEKMSRHELLDWVNGTVNGQHKKIEELCSGVAYCQMMELLFPNCIGVKKIKVNAKLEHEFLHNLKLFQSAFVKLKFDKSVPIDRLIKAKFQDNFEFLQWFKKFFDTHAGGKENLRIPSTASNQQNAPKPIRRPGAQLSVPDLGSDKTSSTRSSKTDLSKTPKNATNANGERAVSPSNLKVLQEQHEKLTAQIGNLEIERNSYYEKLATIEAILNESVKSNEHTDWCNRALAILYAVDDNVPGDEEEDIIGVGEELSELAVGTVNL